MSLYYNFQKWTIITMLSILTVSLVGIVNLVYGFSLEDLNPFKPDEYTQIDNCIKNTPSDQNIYLQIYYCTQGKGYSNDSILRYCVDHLTTAQDWEKDFLCKTAFGIK